MGIPSLSQTNLFSRNDLRATKDQWVKQMHQAVFLTNFWNTKASISLPLLRQKYSSNSEHLLSEWKNGPKDLDQGFL